MDSSRIIHMYLDTLLSISADYIIEAIRAGLGLTWYWFTFYPGILGLLDMVDPISPERFTCSLIIVGMATDMLQH
jgi:hypothetical protein